MDIVAVVLTEYISMAVRKTRLALRFKFEIGSVFDQTDFSFIKTFSWLSFKKKILALSS